MSFCICSKTRSCRSFFSLDSVIFLGRVLPRLMMAIFSVLLSMAYSMRLALLLLRAAASSAFATLSIEKNGRKLTSSCLSKNCLIPSLAGAWRIPVRACTEFLNSSSCWENSALPGFSPRSFAFSTTSPSVGLARVFAGVAFGALSCNGALVGAVGVLGVLGVLGFAGLGLWATSCAPATSALACRACWIALDSSAVSLAPLESSFALAPCALGVLDSTCALVPLALGCELDSALLAFCVILERKLSCGSSFAISFKLFFCWGAWGLSWV